MRTCTIASLRWSYPVSLVSLIFCFTASWSFVRVLRRSCSFTENVKIYLDDFGSESMEDALDDTFAFDLSLDNASCRTSKLTDIRNAYSSFVLGSVLWWSPSMRSSQTFPHLTHKSQQDILHLLRHSIPSSPGSWSTCVVKEKSLFQEPEDKARLESFMIFGSANNGNNGGSHIKMKSASWKKKNNKKL